MKKTFIASIVFVILILLTSCQPEINKYGESEYDCIIIVGVDGGGTFFGASTPKMDSIFSGEHAVITHEATCETPSISAQNWGSFLHGVVPEKHKSTNITIGSQRYPYSKYPSIFKIVRKAYPNSNLASICAWIPINYGLIEESAHVYKNSDKQFMGEEFSDEETTNMVLEYLDKNVPQLMFIHFDETDEDGHRYGYGTSSHKQRLTTTDSYIGKIYDKCMEKAKNPMFIVVCDHGGTLDGEHGLDSDEEMTITIAIKGSTINTNADISSVMPRDIAAIVLEALKIEIPATMDGKVPENLFLE